MTSLIVLQNSGPQPSSWMHELARRAGFQLIPSGDMMLALRALCSVTPAPSEGWSGVLERGGPEAIREVARERGWGRVPVALHDASWVEFLGTPDACVLDLSNAFIWTRGVKAGEDRLVVARHLKDARRLTRHMVAELVSPHRLLYLPSRFNDAQRVDCSLQFLRTKKLLDVASE